LTIFVLPPQKCEAKWANGWPRA